MAINLAMFLADAKTTATWGATAGFLAGFGWIALDRKSARPHVETPRLRVMRFSEAAFCAGVETHKIDGVTVRVYCPAKTVADCFKYRNKVGLDVAIEALRECRRNRKCKIDDVWKYAKVCRVANVMRPYLETIA